MSKLTENELDRLLNSSQADFWDDENQCECNSDQIHIEKIIDMDNIDKIVPVSDVILINDDRNMQITVQGDVLDTENLLVDPKEILPTHSFNSNVPKKNYFENNIGPEDTILQPVLFAGENKLGAIQSDNQVLIDIDSSSGHYSNIEGENKNLPEGELVISNSNAVEFEEQLNKNQREPENTIPINNGNNENDDIASNGSLRKKQMLGRMHGKVYKGLKKEQDSNKWKYIINRNEKERKPFCNSNYCKKSKTRHCYSLLEETKRNIFNNFWEMSWDMKKVYVASLIDIKTPKEKKTDNEVSRRGLTYNYFLFNANLRVQVCKITFLNTLGINQWMAIHFATASNNDRTSMPKETTKTPTRSRQTLTGASAKQFMVKWLQDIPKLESHYCRSTTSKLYLEPVFLSKMDVYRQYKISCVAAGVKVLSTVMFAEEMSSQNICIYKPKKDQCDVCIEYNLGHKTEEEYNEHQKKKEEARTEKQKDKENAERDKSLMVLTVDVQAVLLAPQLQASALYYKTKLCIHNYTVFDLTSRNVTCFLWHEGNGGMESSVFSSLLVSYVEQQLQKNPFTKTIIIYSDSCSYQNKNNIIGNALLLISRQKKITIIQKFLEKGHTQMEVDGAHSMIERKLKNRPIYLPTDYINVCVEARRSHPFEVNYLNFDFFRNFQGLQYYSSIRPGTRRGDPTISKLVALKYQQNIEYKLRFSSDWKELPKKINIDSEPNELPQLYKKCLKIKKEKYLHLQELKSVIPNHAWPFYDSLES